MWFSKITAESLQIKSNFFCFWSKSRPEGLGEFSGRIGGIRFYGGVIRSTRCYQPRLTFELGKLKVQYN